MPENNWEILGFMKHPVSRMEDYPLCGMLLKQKVSSETQDPSSNSESVLKAHADRDSWGCRANSFGDKVATCDSEIVKDGELAAPTQDSSRILRPRSKRKRVTPEKSNKKMSTKATPPEILCEDDEKENCADLDLSTVSLAEDSSSEDEASCLKPPEKEQN